MRPYAQRMSSVEYGFEVDCIRRHVQRNTVLQHAHKASTNNTHQHTKHRHRTRPHKSHTPQRRPRKHPRPRPPRCVAMFPFQSCFAAALCLTCMSMMSVMHDAMTFLIAMPVSLPRDDNYHTENMTHSDSVTCQDIEHHMSRRRAYKECRVESQVCAARCMHVPAPLPRTAGISLMVIICCTVSVTSSAHADKNSTEARSTITTHTTCTRHTEANGASSPHCTGLSQWRVLRVSLCRCCVVLLLIACARQCCAGFGPSVAGLPVASTE